MSLLFTVVTYRRGLVNGVEGGGGRGSGVSRFLLLRRRLGRKGEGGAVLLSANLGLDDPSANLVRFEVFDRAGRQEGFLDVGVGIGEGEQDEGGVLPVGDSEVVRGATGAKFVVAVELVLEGTVVGERGVDEFLIVE